MIVEVLKDKYSLLYKTHPSILLFYDPVMSLATLGFSFDEIAVSLDYDNHLTRIFVFNQSVLLSCLIHLRHTILNYHRMYIQICHKDQLC